MTKGKLQDGRPFIGIRVEHFVKAADFAHALADYCWVNSIQFDKKMKKSEALKILSSQLFSYGNEGNFDPEQFQSADQEIYDEWAIPYEDAKQWVLKNYPYLKRDER